MQVANSLLYLAFCFLAGSGLAMKFGLDEGTLFGIGEHDWGEIHFYVALVVIGLLGFHLWINRSWLKTLYSKAQWPTVIVGGSGLAIVALFLLAPTVGGGQRDDDAGENEEHHEHDDDD